MIILNITEADQSVRLHGDCEILKGKIKNILRA